MANSWNRFNRGDCPVCNGARKDCRQNLETNFIHCRDAEANPPDYKFRGQDAWGFGMWQPTADAEAWKDERRQEWQREQQAAREARERQEREHYAKSLSVEERDRAIRKILDQLPLTPEHRQQLHSRGLTEAEIKNGGFRSVEKWQKLDFPVTDSLAGVKRGGRSLLTPDSGIICPIPDQDGRFIGWQLRRDNPEDGGKYLWPGGDKKLSPRPSAHLPNGELPIAVWMPSDCPLTGIVGLTEGTAIKPQIASLKLGIPVIGAAGGNHASSPEQLKASLEATGASIVRLYADGGAVLNPSVTKQYERTFDLLKEWGYQVEVAWWGQFEKSDGDIDEIPDAKLAQIEYLSPDKFREIAKEEQFKRQGWESWHKAKKFTPQVQIEKQFFNYDLPQSGSISLIKSGLGTGKTTQLVQWFLSSLIMVGAVALGYRNTLLLQFCEKAKFYHLHEDSHDVNLADPTIWVASCIDSILRYPAEFFDGKIIVLDEVVSIVKHLLFSPTIKNRREVIDRFSKAIRCCDRVICFDALMTDWVVKFLTAICPEKQILSIENTYQGQKAEFHLLEGTIDEKGNVKANDKAPWFVKLLEAEYPVVCSDNQVFLEALEKKLIEQDRQGIRIDSKTINELKVKEFLAKPTAFIEKYKPEYLLYSPSSESGLDVNIPDYFDSHFGFFFGVIDVDGIQQMMARVRDVNVPKFLWVRKVAIPTEGIEARSYQIETIEYYRRKALTHDLHDVMSGEIGGTEMISNILSLMQQSKDPAYDCALQLEAIRNFERVNLRECVVNVLTNSGHSVTPYLPSKAAGDKETTEAIKQATDEVKDQNSRDIFNASDRYVGQPDIRLNFDANWEKRCEVIKAKILNQLPGIQFCPFWSPEFIRKIQYDQPSLLPQLERFYLLQNPDIALQLSRDKYLKLNQKFLDGEQIVPWKLRQEYSVIKVLEDIGLLDLLENPEATYTADSPEIGAIFEKVKRSKKIQQTLKRKPGKDPIKFVGWLLKLIGVKWKTRQVREGSQRVRHYSIDFTALNDPTRLAILDAIARRYDRLLNRQTVTSPFSHQAENESQKSEFSQPTLKTASIPVPTRDSAVTDDPIFYINQTGLSVTDKTPPSGIKNMPVEAAAFAVGQRVRNRFGGEPLRVKAVGDDGYVQVEGVYSGLVCHSHVEVLEVA